MRTLASTTPLLATAALLAIAAPNVRSAGGQPPTYGDPASPFTTTQPGAQLGPVQAAPPTFDPYADPRQPYPATVVPHDNLLSQPGAPFSADPNAPFYAQPIRFLQAVDFEFTYLPRLETSGGLGLVQGEVYGTFALPIGNQGFAPLEITPGLAVQFWDGPAGTASLLDPDLPPQTYGAYLDAGWRPQLTENLSAELGVRPGIYADFRELNDDSIRIKGRGLGIYRFAENWSIALGVVYLDRLDVKILPAGGFLWTPNPDVHYRIFFPNPKLAHRVTTIGNIEWWWYVGGEYGGDSWTLRRAAAVTDQFDYNDIRVFLGLEWKPTAGLSGLEGRVELGYVFQRELFYRSTQQRFDLEETLMLRAGLRY